MKKYLSLLIGTILLSGSLGFSINQTKVTAKILRAREVFVSDGTASMNILQAQTITANDLNLFGNLTIVNGLEIVSNGDFTKGEFNNGTTNGWTPFGSTLHLDSGEMTISCNGGLNYVFQEIALEIGHKYTASMEVVSDNVSGNMYLWVGTTATNNEMGGVTLSSGIDTIGFTFSALSDNGYLIARNSSAITSDSWAIDNLSIREVSALYAEDAVLSGDVTVGGGISGTTIAGTITTVSQPNITSVGTLSDLAVTNTIVGSINGNAGTVSTIAGLAPDTATTQASQPNITSVGTLTSLTSSGGISATTGTFSDDVGITGKISLNDGGRSVFIGEGAGLNDDGTDNRNVGVGYQSLLYNTTGSYNTANGYYSLRSNTTGIRNTATGVHSLYHNTTGSNNTGLGYQAGRYITDGTTTNETGTYNTFIGSDTKALAGGDTNETVIGNGAVGAGSNTVTLGNDDITDTYLKGDVSVGGAISATTGTFSGGISGTIVREAVTTIVSSATPTINSDNCAYVTITALATNITSMTTNLSGTPTNFQKLIFRIKDNGTSRSITWGSDFEAKGVALPTATTASKVLATGFIYDTVTSKWGCVASVEES